MKPKIDQNCMKCGLMEGRSQVVEGLYAPYENTVCFIGEAPGEKEDLKGEPFVGKSGKLLDELMSNINLHRAQVSIFNIAKCRPPNNRAPVNEEAAVCGRIWLTPQINYIKPKILVALGGTSAKYLMKEQFFSLKQSRLQILESRFDIPLIVMYHPAFALYRGSNRKYLDEDFKFLQTYLNDGKEVEKEKEGSLYDWF